MKSLCLLLLILSVGVYAEDVYGIQTIVSFDKCADKKHPDASKCAKEILGVEPSGIELTGGFCEDDLSFVQKLPNGDLQVFALKHQCSAVFEQDLFDKPPAHFSCHANGKSPVAGASYKKIKDMRDADDPEAEFVPNRYYVYQCTKGCANKPKTLLYTVSDCG